MFDEDHIRQRLETWGATDQPLPDGAFTNRLETDLRQMADERPSRRRSTLRQPAIFVVATLLVLLGSFAFLRARSAETVLVMTAASQTEVVLPDGEVVVGAIGTELPEGTRIRVGSDGSATVDGVILPRGSEAIVSNGSLEILSDRAPQRPSTTASPTTAVRRSTSSSPASTSTPTTPQTSAPSDTVATTATTTADARPTTTRSPTTRPSTSSTIVDTPPPAEVTLEATIGDARVVLTWNYVGPETIDGWEVIARSGDRSRTVVVIRDPAVRSVTVEQLDSRVVYRVLARAADGSIVAESNAVTVG